MRPAERLARVPEILRDHGEPMKASQLAGLLGVSHRTLTGSSDSTLFLLEERGVIGRTGRNRGTRWHLEEAVDG